MEDFVQGTLYVFILLFAVSPAAKNTDLLSVQSLPTPASSSCSNIPAQAKRTQTGQGSQVETNVIESFVLSYMEPHSGSHLYPMSYLYFCPTGSSQNFLRGDSSSSRKEENKMVG